MSEGTTSKWERVTIWRQKLYLALNQNFESSKSKI